jgi:hypothetical protein
MSPVNVLHVGHVDEILAGGGAAKDIVHGFVQDGHLAEKDGEGRSYAAIGILATGAVWLWTGPSKPELIEAMQSAGVTEAEILELTTLN